METEEVVGGSCRLVGKGPGAQPADTCQKSWPMKKKLAQMERAVFC